jgi:hypothetical protein
MAARIWPHHVRRAIEAQGRCGWLSLAMALGVTFEALRTMIQTAMEGIFYAIMGKKRVKSCISEKRFIVYMAQSFAWTPSTSPIWHTVDIRRANSVKVIPNDSTYDKVRVRVQSLYHLGEVGAECHHLDSDDLPAISKLVKRTIYTVTSKVVQCYAYDEKSSDVFTHPYMVDTPSEFNKLIELKTTQEHTNCVILITEPRANHWEPLLYDPTAAAANPAPTAGTSVAPLISLARLASAPAACVITAAINDTIDVPGYGSLRLTQQVLHALSMQSSPTHTAPVLSSSPLPATGTSATIILEPTQSQQSAVMSSTSGSGMMAPATPEQQTQNMAPAASLLEPINTSTPPASNGVIATPAGDHAMATPIVIAASPTPLKSATASPLAMVCIGTQTIHQ